MNSLGYESFEASVEFRDFDGVVLDLEVNTPPFLNHDDSRCVVFSDHIRIKCLNNISHKGYDQTKKKKLMEREREKRRSLRCRLFGFGFS